MAKRKHLLHVKSNVAEEAKQYGIDKFLVTPKKPVDSTTGKATDDTLLYGEIAVNYGKGVEALIIRNQEDNVVAFVNENDFYEAGKITAEGLATEKMEREESVAAEAVAREQAIAAEKLAREQADIDEANERAQAIDAEASARDQAIAAEAVARDQAIAAEKLAREESEFVTSNALTYLDKKIDTSTVSAMVSITYAEMKELREQSKLKAGQFYRITDYVTTTTQENTQSAGHVFDVIVLATDVNTLNENAKAIKHEGDTYFDNSNLDAWELKYDLDNDQSKYAWADETNGKGVIYYLKDEFDNECPYDFKNIQFKRYKLKDNTGIHVSDYLMKNKQYVKLADNFVIIWQNRLNPSVVDTHNISFYYTKGIYADGYLVSGADIFTSNNNYDSYDNGNLILNESSGGNYISLLNLMHDFDVIAEVADINGEWFYTFSQKTTETSASIDISLDKTCYSNSMQESVDMSNIKNLNDNIFIYLGTVSRYIYNNHLDRGCYNNTFGYGWSNKLGNDCFMNTFGDSCESNTFGDGCHDNTFGDSCYSNTFGDGCHDNTFGDSCESNTFGDGCGSITFGDIGWRNTFGDGCESNTFGVKCFDNTFGNNCSNNTFGDSCYSNTFGYGCESNTFGNNFNSNTFGNNCNHNTFGDECENNTFGNNIQYVKFEKDFMWYNIVESGNTYITVTSSETTSSSIHLRNFTIAQGVNNATNETQRKTISHNTTNDTFKTTYQNANSKTVNV